METQNDNKIDLIGQILLEQIQNIHSSNGEAVKAEIEKAKAITSAANQFANLEKTKLSIEMYKNRHELRGYSPTKIDNLQNSKPIELEETTQKKSGDLSE